MNKHYAFTAPGCYRIEVQGALRAGWSGRLGAMQVLPVPDTNDNNISVLEGCVSDQSELSGILNTLYELHMSLISVKYLGNDLPESEVTDE
jgi:hypothetical protein